jgi:Asp-tRNA(Asn)/Glu-tRNA(Gln) amidotransferase A subunit family amidase
VRWPLTPQVAALRDGEDDPVAVADRCCDRIEAVDAELLAFVAEPDRRGRLRGEAHAVAARWPSASTRRPALYGIPVGIKDIMHVSGLPTAAGSALPPEELAGAQAGVIDRLRAAGALIAGKTVTAEFAATAPGPTRNPHDLGHSPGGSSSGSAAAVAAGMVPLALGTQTIGSVGRPAAYCGVVGFKPSRDRVPADGVIPNATSFDTVGWFASDVAGVALAAGVLCDDWRDDLTGRQPPVLGVPVGPYLDHTDDAARAAFERHLDVLRRAGFTVRDIPMMGDFAAIRQTQRTIGRFEIARAHARWFPRFASLYHPQTAAAIRVGLDVKREDYETALRERDDFARGIAVAMQREGIDAWITPAATSAAPRGLDTTGDPTMSLPWSVARMPAVSLPAGHTPNGLPLGVQCVAAGGEDEVLLGWAANIEAALAVA